MTNRELKAEIQRNFDEIGKSTPTQIKKLLETIIHQAGRLKTEDRNNRLLLSKIILDLKNMLISEKSLAEITTSKSSEYAFGESFLKSIYILKDELINLASKIE
jgi:hypothetical protein